jgi:prolyl-tRNA synthetase
MAEAAVSCDDLQVIVIPSHSRRNLEMLTTVCTGLEKMLRDVNVRVAGDYRNSHKASWKYGIYEKAGVPIRLEVGERELASQSVVLAQRGSDSQTTRKVVLISDLGRVVKETLGVQ